MLYTALTKKAMQIAYNAHQGQLDKSGLPYILHPIHVAEKMNTEIETCVALLHDVFEDCDQKYKYEILEKFGSEIAYALTLLTHDKTISYMDYIQVIKDSENQCAINVKLEDLNHNCDLSRLDSITDKDLKRFNKYCGAIDILTK
jgi:(p)ppGpp synthase/HD superfamily hydrolase